jgi:hypothetical protein
VRIGSAFQHGADQARLERGEKAHRLDGGLASLSQQLRLAVGEKQALVFAQRLLDLQIARQRLRFENAQSFGCLQLGVVKIADTVLAHQAGGFLGDAHAIALQAIMRVDAVVFASRHGALLISGWQRG